jgi:hypothetical protein
LIHNFKWALNDQFLHLHFLLFHFILAFTQIWSYF